MASTFVNIISRILTQPKSLTGIDPSQSNCLSSKMSFHIYGKKNFANPKNIAAFFCLLSADMNASTNSNLPSIGLK